MERLELEWGGERGGTEERRVVVGACRGTRAMEAKVLVAGMLIFRVVALLVCW